MTVVDHRLVAIALKQVNGEDFEHFVNAFYPALTGTDFIPLGGVHDGGADAFLDAEVSEGAKPGTFFQSSIQENHIAKIRQTAHQLQKAGREPKAIIYVTAQTIKKLDIDEERLTKETGVFVRIRDGNWIVSNINHSHQTIAAYKSYLEPRITFLAEIGGAQLVETTANLDNRAVCVFLGQEVSRRCSNSTLLESVTDSLILWSLEGTDPDEGLFMTRPEILSKIEDILPRAKQFVRGVLDQRLGILSKKGNPVGREVRRYKKEDKYCLPFETRKIVESENIEDEFLKTRVLQIFEERARLVPEEVSPVLAAQISLRAIELTFETQGLELATFLSGEKCPDTEPAAISEQVDKAILEKRLAGKEAVSTKIVAMASIRKSFYESSEEERKYFSKLSRTYSLLFSLQADPRVVEYFQSMSSRLVLFIGTDLFVRALSEQYLNQEDQMTGNMLRMLKDAGADLVLAQPVANEIHHHIRTSDREFSCNFERSEPYVDTEIASHSPRILVRAYFYAKLNPISEIGGPSSWKAFIEQFCDYSKLHMPDGNKQIRKYLLEKFGLRFISDDELFDLTSEEEIVSLTDMIATAKEVRDSERILAENDAKMVLGVYGTRKNLREDHKVNPYGYRTWWLTHETRVLKGTTSLVEKKNSRYMMRPEFLLNFIALSPTTAQVRRSYAKVFPTLLGVKLSNRMREEVFQSLLSGAQSVEEMDDARVKVKMGDLSDKLKTDRRKEYERSFTLPFEPE